MKPATLFEGITTPVIGMVQPPALPGSGGWRGQPFKDILEFALADAQALIEGGIDAVLVQNMWDGPIKETATPQAISHMSVIAQEIRRLTRLPLGVSLLANDGPANLSVAAAAEADFVRLKVYVGIMIRGSGLIPGCAAEAIAARKLLGCEHIRILADVHDRSGTPLGNPPLAGDVEGAVWSHADALIITGRNEEELIQMLSEARQASAGLPIVLGGGTRVENLARLLPLVDGVIVGATLKRNGQDPEPVDSRASSSLHGCRSGTESLIMDSAAPRLPTPRLDVNRARPLLAISALQVKFKTDEGLVHAVNGISFELGAGETLGIIGESGSGKTVSMLAVMGLIPTPPGKISGSVRFEGKELLTMDEAQRRKMRGSQIAMVFQDPMTSLNPVLTIGRQVSETLRLHLNLGEAAARQKTIELLDAVGIPDASRRYSDYPHRFSGGMRQRVMIAIGLACQPRLLIVDEPTTALDVTIQAQTLSGQAASSRFRAWR